MSQPEYLYKYFSADRIEEILTQNKIFFPTPADFNDPFDCKFQEKQISRRKREQYARDMLRERAPHVPKWHRKQIAAQPDYIFAESHSRFISRIHQHLGVLCLSERRDNILMWSHYARNHTGVCLEFRRFGLLSGSLTFLPLQVRYSNQFPVANFLEMAPFINGSDAITASKQKEFIELIYLTKAKDWEYEREWRVLDIAGAQAGRERGWRSISPEYLTG